MPPTTFIVPIHSHLKRISNPLHQQSRRQLIQPEQTAVNPDTSGADTKTDTTLEGFAPYSPPPSLHAAILPLSAVAEPHGSAPRPFHRPSPSSGQIIAITVSIVFSSILCILALVLALSRSKKLKTVFTCIKRQPTAIARSTPPEDLVIDIRAGSTQEVAYPDSESGKSDEVEGSFESDISEGPIPPPHYVPPSVSSRECAVLEGDVPSLAAFWSRTGVEEADGCLATGITIAGPGSGSINSIADSPSTRASWNAKNRIRQGSNASESTNETATSDIFSIANSGCSSKTSLRRGGDSQEDIEIEDDLNTEETTFEVARARTQSVEIKRGILINWGGECGRASCGKFEGSTVPSVMVTCASTLSSLSVDLSEFPLPPDDVVYMVET